MAKKSIIMTSVGLENSVAIAFLEANSGEILFNMKYKNEIKNPYLAFHNNKNCQIAKLKYQAETYSARIYGSYKVGDNVSCVIMSDGVAIKPILIGTTENKSSFSRTVINNISTYKNLIDDESKKIGLMANDNIDEEIDAEMTDHLLEECLSVDNKCEKCIYKKVFFSNPDDEISLINTNSNEDKYADKSLDNNEEEIEHSVGDLPEDSEIIDEPKPKFYSQIYNSINDLFTNYPNDDLLENAITNSKFVRVNYDGTDEYYSVGIIKENEKIKYIVYAIPSVVGSEPPADLENFSQWIAIDNEIGYWLMYQDSENGESVLFGGNTSE